MRRKMLGVVGPTATGKTAVGIALAKMLGGEIISADSMSVYKGMDIGTAKPSLVEQREARFHLIDVGNPLEAFSVAEFKRLALVAAGDIWERTLLPIVVGGTGLYVNTLTGGWNIPEVPPDYEFRDTLREEAAVSGGEHLLEKLRKVDPPTAERLHANDQMRIIRALEVYAKTGVPISQLHAEAGRIETGWDVRLYGLTMRREVLYERIESRVDSMIEAGLVDEVRGLLSNGCTPDMTSMKGLGYKEIAGYLLGEYSLDEAVEILKRDTRRFAKRQMTWFRADSRIQWLDVESISAHEAAERICGMCCIDAE